MNPTRALVRDSALSGHRRKPTRLAASLPWRGILVTFMLPALLHCRHVEPRSDVAVYKDRALVPAQCTELAPISASDGVADTPPNARTGTEVGALRKLQDAAAALGGNALFLDERATMEAIPTDAARGWEFHFQGVAFKCPEGAA